MATFRRRGSPSGENRFRLQQKASEKWAGEVGGKALVSGRQRRPVDVSSSCRRRVGGRALKAQEGSDAPAASRFISREATRCTGLLAPR